MCRLLRPLHGVASISFSIPGFAPPVLVVDDSASSSSFTPSTWLASSNAPPGFAFSTVPATDDDYLVNYYISTIHDKVVIFHDIFRRKCFLSSLLFSLRKPQLLIH